MENTLLLKYIRFDDLKCIKHSLALYNNTSQTECFDAAQLTLSLIADLSVTFTGPSGLAAGRHNVVLYVYPSDLNIKLNRDALEADDNVLKVIGSISEIAKIPESSLTSYTIEVDELNDKGVLKKLADIANASQARFDAELDRCKLKG